MKSFEKTKIIKFLILHNILLKLFFVPILFILMISIVSALKINEIMYNPSGSDFDFEYVELYSEDVVNVTDYYFSGIDFTFPEYSFQGYLVIANTKKKDGIANDFEDRYGFAPEFDFVGSLTNTGETIALFDPQGGKVDEVSYSDTAREDYSLESDGYSFVESRIILGTPRQENSVIIQQNSSGGNGTNGSIFDTEDGCDFSIQVSTDRYIYENGESIKFRPLLVGATGDFQIDYEVTDINQNVVKPKKSTENTNEKSFTANIQETDKTFIIHMTVMPECDDRTENNNYANASVVVRNNDVTEEDFLKPKLEIKDIDLGSDHKAFFGETIKVEFDVRPGNTTKKMLKVYVDEVGDAISIEIKKDQEVIIPIKLADNCNDQFLYGSYPIIAEGFDMTAFKPVYIEGINEKNCKGYVGFGKAKEITDKNEVNQKIDANVVSFYTRAKVFEENKSINLFVNIDSNEEFLTKIFQNEVLVDQREKESKFNFSLTLEPFNNSLILELYREDLLVGTKNISIYAEPLHAQAVLKTDGERFKKPVAIQETGDTEQKSDGKKGFMNYLMLAMSVALNTVLIWKR